MLREKAKASRHRAILDAADKQFAKRPYHEVLLDDIAADAQVAKGTLYLYFENKADLYLALIVESIAPLIERLQPRVRAEAEKSAWAGIKLLVQELIVFNVDHPALHEVLWETSLAARAAICGEVKRVLVTLVEQTIRKGIARGELIDPAPEATTDLILWAIPRAARWTDIEQHQWSAEAAAAHLLQLLGHGLLVRKKRQRRINNAKAGAAHD